MKLNMYMKHLIAFCYTNENALRYEFIFDKQTTTSDYFAVRFFLNEYSYFLIEFPYSEPYLCKVTEFETVKSSYHPSPRVHFINKYLGKYRDKKGNYFAVVNVEDLTKRLSTIPKPQGFCCDRVTYSPWRNVRRASGRF